MLNKNNLKFYINLFVDSKYEKKMLLSSFLLFFTCDEQVTTIDVFFNLSNLAKIISDIYEYTINPPST